jgi:hypothetical protein
MILRLSVLLNLLLAGGVVFIVVSERKEVTIPVPKEAKAPVAEVASPGPSQPDVRPQPFHWQQLDSVNDYRLFIANLRAIGCPENTIEDIVRGNVSRAFEWERSRQKIGGSGNGPWSDASETALVDGLMGKPSTWAAATSLQNANGQSANRQAALPPAEAGNPAFQSAQNGQDDSNRQADKTLQSEILQFYPWAVQRNGGMDGSFSSAQLAVPSQQPGNSSGAMQISVSAGPQNSVPALGNPIDAGGGQAMNGQNSFASPNSPVGPPDPLGPNDPFAKSSQDIMNQDINAYDDWFNQQIAGQAGSDMIGINLAGAPQ